MSKKENKIKVAAEIYRQLKKYGIDAVLTGGACVSIYTRNKYESSDLDFVTTEILSRIDKALAPIGFSRNKNIPYYRRDGGYYSIQFLSPPLAVGQEIIKKPKLLKTKFGEIKLLSPTDSVKDRLAAYFYWNDHQSFEQALMIAQKQKINLKEISLWAQKEGQTDKYQEFKNKLKNL